MSFQEEKRNSIKRYLLEKIRNQDTDYIKKSKFLILDFYFFKLLIIELAASAPSPVAVTTWYKLLLITSPAA